MKHKLLACALALATTPALADEVGQWYVSPQAGYLITDHKRVRDNEWIYGLGIGNNIAEHFSLELNANNTQLHRSGTNGLDLTAVSLDALFYPNRNLKVAPYFLLGAGVIRDDNNPSFPGGKSNVLYEGGLGARILLWESANKAKSFSLRPELKIRYDDIAKGHYSDYIGAMGFQIGFGNPPPAAPMAAAPPPPPPPAAPPPPPPIGDEDHDGVPDNLDRCPGTAPGVMVDIYGCEQKGSILLEGVTFEFNSATLTSESKPVLDKVATGLKSHRRVKVELQGHTDSVGKDAYNQKLSERRADSVRTYLVEQGVASSQLSSKGYGETKPVADNKTEEGRAKNRRVVMEVLENPRDIAVKGEGKAEETAR